MDYSVILTIAKINIVLTILFLIVFIIFLLIENKTKQKFHKISLFSFLILIPCFFSATFWWSVATKFSFFSKFNKDIIFYTYLLWLIFQSIASLLLASLTVPLFNKLDLKSKNIKNIFISLILSFIKSCLLFLPIYGPLFLLIVSMKSQINWMNNLYNFGISHPPFWEICNLTEWIAVGLILVFVVLVLLENHKNSKGYTILGSLLLLLPIIISSLSISLLSLYLQQSDLSVLSWLVISSDLIISMISIIGLLWFFNLLTRKFFGIVIWDLNFDIYAFWFTLLFIILFTLLSSMIASYCTIPLANFIKEMVNSNFISSFWIWVGNIANIITLIGFFIGSLKFLITKIKSKIGIIKW